MKFPVDREAFTAFIEESKIFELTMENLQHYLETWYKDEPEQFIDNLWADYETVMRIYCFKNRMVSFNKNFNFEPPMDTVSCEITIYDAENTYCTTYKMVFDYELNVLDDMMS